MRTRFSPGASRRNEPCRHLDSRTSDTDQSGSNDSTIKKGKEKESVGNMRLNWSWKSQRLISHMKKIPVCENLCSFPRNENSPLSLVTSPSSLAPLTHPHPPKWPLVTLPIAFRGVSSLSGRDPD